MELIYLYIEDYKNIKNQGFNFSSKFTCKYDEVKKTLQIDEKNNHIENFFGENINITAIVGENGSGKSSVQKIFFSLIYHRIIKNLKVNKSEEIDAKDMKIFNFMLENLNKDIKYSNNFAILNTEDGIKKVTISDKYKNIKFNEKVIKELEAKEVNFFSIHFNYMIDTWNDGDILEKWIQTIYHRVDGYRIPLLLEPFKGMKEQIIDIDHLEYLNIQKMVNNLKILDNINLTKFFSPNKIRYSFPEVKVNTFRLLPFVDEIKNTDSEYLMAAKIVNKLLDYIERNNIKFTKEQPNSIQAILSIFDKTADKNIPKTKDRYYYNNTIYVCIKILNLNPFYLEQEKYKQLKQKFDELIQEKDQNKIMEKLFDLGKLNISNIIIKEHPSNFKIRKCIEFKDNILENENNFNKFIKFFDKVEFIDNVKEIIDFLPPWLDVEFFQDIKSFKSLSSGEKNLYSFINNLHYQINKVIEYKFSTINIFCDEVEYGLHPDWQKKIINELFYSLKQYTNKDFKINIYFATHSPFILSDIPKQNIVFLKDGKQVDAMEKKQTFGANIHTLLADGFFMDGGLMGEFAKAKIEEVIKYLNDENSEIKSKEEAQKIINIIGEPILKNQLQKMLDSKRFEKIDKIDELEEQIKFLNHRLDILRKNQ
ncbi:AAA family ATPase [Aliarcobacter cryaerophilus]|uniref:AAA family ATPase n=1 Tax=Aliarcobacter cryaerophilus TaxID=28198 RepID=UPI0021B52D44|nr:AAA family ATPase [Aliarcobacter cryaerophilus]MCT7541245.1 AAA family ATPase [Aliarcobacter cryaerophilus]